MNSSPYAGSERDYYYQGRERFSTATPSPSPRANYYPSTPVRPATRAHFRHTSSGFSEFPTSPRPPTQSPRYTSDGFYATANVSGNHQSRRKSFSHPPPLLKRERRPSFVHVRPSIPHGESDDDDEIVIMRDGTRYTIPAV